MLQLLFIAVIIYIYFKFKKVIKSVFDRAKNNRRKMVVKIRPGLYRDYSPTVTLTEIVHYEVLDDFGVCREVVVKNYDQIYFIVEDILKEEMSVDQFCRVVGERIESSKTFSEKTIFSLFLSGLKKANQDKVIKIKVEDIVKAIEFAF